MITINLNLNESEGRAKVDVGRTDTTNIQIPTPFQNSLSGGFDSTSNSSVDIAPVPSIEFDGAETSNDLIPEPGTEILIESADGLMDVPVPSDDMVEEVKSTTRKTSRRSSSKSTESKKN